MRGIRSLKVRVRMFIKLHNRATLPSVILIFQYYTVDQSYYGGSVVTLSLCVCVHHIVDR